MGTVGTMGKDNIEDTHEAGAIIIVALTNDFSTSNNNTAMPVMEFGIRCLLEAQRKIGVSTRRHFFEKVRGELVVIICRYDEGVTINARCNGEVDFSRLIS